MHQSILLTNRQTDRHKQFLEGPSPLKIIEEYLLEIHIDFLIANNVLYDNHHGGRSDHSPETAMTNTQLGMGYNCDNNLIHIILSTDSTTAYDTVDHCMYTC